MDPEEADLFYVPAYVACYAWPVLGWADFPWWYSAGGRRQLLVLLLSHALRFVLWGEMLQRACLARGLCDVTCVLLIGVAEGRQLR